MRWVVGGAPRISMKQLDPALLCSQEDRLQQSTYLGLLRQLLSQLRRVLRPPESEECLWNSAHHLEPRSHSVQHHPDLLLDIPAVETLAALGRDDGVRVTPSAKPGGAVTLTLYPAHATPGVAASRMTVDRARRRFIVAAWISSSVPGRAGARGTVRV